MAKPPKPKPSKSAKPPKPKPPAVTQEERDLFLAAVGGAAPLAARDRVAVPPKPPAPVRVVEHPPAATLAVEGDARSYRVRGPGVSVAQIDELRRGRVHVEDTLDLHGEAVAAAVTKLGAYLAEAKRIGRRCVRVVHGRGAHSEHGAPLREAVLGELLGGLSGYVHALVTAPASEGGEGATLVMVRSR